MDTPARGGLSKVPGALAPGEDKKYPRSQRKYLRAGKCFPFGRYDAAETGGDTAGTWGRPTQKSQGREQRDRQTAAPCLSSFFPFFLNSFLASCLFSCLGASVPAPESAAGVCLVSPPVGTSCPLLAEATSALGVSSLEIYRCNGVLGQSGPHRTVR